MIDQENNRLQIQAYQILKIGKIEQEAEQGLKLQKAEVIKKKSDFLLVM